jgi:hypothetical protein
MGLMVGVTAGVFAGCNGFSALPSGPSDSVAVAVGDKAEAVARQIGGDSGYGGTLMTGYLDHAPAHMGFVDASSLAGSGGKMTVRFVNETGLDCTFDLDYVASYLGLNEQSDPVVVPAGGQLDYEMPCAEIMGLGDLESPGSAGCVLVDGQTVPNVMAVPAFLGLDYVCGGMHEFRLTPDVADLDGDGDTEELVIVSEAFEAHMGFGGPMGHAHSAEMHGGGAHRILSGSSGVRSDDQTSDGTIVN